MRLLLIRHGQTPANVEGILETSRPGPALTDLGRLQAAALPAALADEAISALYVSVLVRTHLTAAPLAAALGIVPEELSGIHEIEAGSLEGRRDRESVRAYLGTLQTWGGGDLTARMPGGPSGEDFFARFDADVARVAADHPGETVALVSHGAAIRVWCGGRALNIDPGFSARTELANTGIVALDGTPETGWTVLTWEGDPLGGERLDDEAALDPAGEPIA